LVRSAADVVVIVAIVPAVPAIVTMVIVVVETLARLGGDHTGGCKCDKPHQEAAFDYALCSSHDGSSTVDGASLARAGPGISPLLSAIGVSTLPT
jgi:hypothetical protein